MALLVTRQVRHVRLVRPSVLYVHACTGVCAQLRNAPGIFIARDPDFSSLRLGSVAANVKIVVYP